MTVINEQLLDAANTAFEDAANAIFEQTAPGHSAAFTEMVSATGKVAELDLVDGIPQVREWLGAKRFEQLEAFTVTRDLQKWELSLRVSVDDINQDKSGVVARRLRALAARASAMYEKPLRDFLIDNNVACYDGQNLLANAHPLDAGNPQGASYDNLTTNALSYGEFETGWQTLAEMTDDKGEPLDVRPSHLMVGPAQAELAMQVTGSDKVVGIGDDANLVAAGGSGLDNGVGGMLPNFIGGSVAVIVHPRLYGNEWFLMDLTKPGLKPLYGFEFQSPQTTIMDSPDDDNVFHDDEVLYSITARMTPVPGLPQLIYGSVTN